MEGLGRLVGAPWQTLSLQRGGAHRYGVGMDIHENAQATAERLKSRFGEAPATAIVLGSGLSGLVDRLSPLVGRAPFGEVGLPTTGVAGHAGEIAVGSLGAARVALLAGRVHAYEGHPPSRVVAAVRALAAWGVPRLIVTSAVGGLHADQPPGTLVRLVDHINLSGQNPLVGVPPWPGRPRFPDLSGAYDAVMGDELSAAAAALDIPLPKGVYAAMSGPSYETPAEVRMLQVLGGDVVGMSTVMEVIAAADAGMKAIGISVIANPAAGLTVEPLRHEDVTREVDAAAGRLKALLTEFLTRCPG
jgi:purine-nucleoside phosphorylase